MESLELQNRMRNGTVILRALFVWSPGFSRFWRQTAKAPWRWQKRKPSLGIAVCIRLQPDPGFATVDEMDGASTLDKADEPVNDTIRIAGKRSS